MRIPEWKDLKNDAILHMDVLEELWPDKEKWNNNAKGIDANGRQHRLLLLEHYGLVLPLLWHNKQYLVPALLRDEQPEHVEHIKSFSHRCEFLFQLGHEFEERKSYLDSSNASDSFLPRALLLRLLGACVQMVQVTNVLGQTSM